MRPLLKYCGNHSLSDLQQVRDSEADYVGVVFASSGRQVTATSLALWLNKVTLNNKQKLVGLFVNPTLEEITNVIKEVPLDIIQLHGTETPEFVAEIKEKCQLPLWKVIHHEIDALKKMEAYSSIVTAFVIDSKVKGAWGGTGITFDWSHIPTYIQEGRRLNLPVFIAGGINGENISDLLTYEPDGIDISSGIERNGMKDIDEMKRIEKRINNHEHKLSR